ncbi:hypothetical protein [Streptomyces torulosus]|uniref:hypothetical protein n=1 Tax=Streptomyces torulosus TaxID=68276 RepID=UPI0006EBA77D|nr:hypothetical protein [Streptomyces torulosus]
MTVLILSGVLALVIGGCACVFWAARGGPRWVRAVATATLAVGELLRLVDPLRSSNRKRGDT